MPAFVRRYRLAAGRVRLRVEQLEDRVTPATANPDAFNVSGLSFTLTAPGVLANDTLGTSETGPLVAALVSSPPPASGTLAFNPDGSFTFTPAPGLNGTVTFNYQAQGSGGLTAPSTATVTLNVTSPPPATVPLPPPAAPLPPLATPVPLVPPAPPPTHTALYAVGAGGGAGPLVRVFNADGTERFTFFAFDESFRGGVRVAVADVTGDGVDDIVAAPGDGGGPVVRVFDGVTGQLVRGFELFGGEMRVGLHVAAGDLNADGFADIVVGVGSTGGPAVQVIDGRTGTPGATFFAYDPAFRGGVRVAVGDTDGDGAADIVTVPGPSGGPVVRVFDAAGGPESIFTALDPAYRGGAFVAVLAGSVVVSPDSFPDFAGTALDDTLPDTDGLLPPAGPTAGVLATGPQVFTYTANGSELQRLPVFGPEVVTGVRVSPGVYQGATGLFVSAGPNGGGRVQFFPLVVSVQLAFALVLSDTPTLDATPLPGGFSAYVGGNSGL